MDIYPEDLEPACRAQIQRERGQMYTSTGKSVDGRIKGLLAGFIPGAIFLGALFTAVAGNDSVFFFGGIAGSALGYTWGHFVDRDNLSTQHIKKVTVEEISLISKAETDPLKMGHLGLICELISMQSFQDPTVERSIRSAVRDIGFGIAGLPGQPAEELLRDAGTFQEEASRLTAKAAQESDPVVAASFQRQADARNQRAEAIARNSALARRNQILRHEMGEHIKTLKTMLDVTALEDSGEGYGLAALAANIQQVAIEARSLTEAKKELAYALEEGQGGRKNVIPEQPQIQGLSGQ